MGGWMKSKEKRGLIEKAADCPAMTQNELAAWAKSTFKLKRAAAQTTVSDILKQAASIMNPHYGDENRRKPLHVTSPALEAALWAWIQKLEVQGTCLSRELIT
uniref:HTH CENPB-type domain-containing protein n=1 Tax=Phytophthora ramorum TaxID=164328 RepID=H3GM27_PHYRM